MHGLRARRQPAEPLPAALSPTGGGPAREGHGTRRSWALLVLLSVAQFMVILDATVVNVALPSIGRSLHFAPGGLQWVVTAYVLASGGLVLAGGRAADLFGRRRMFLAGLATFTAASLASGLAMSPAALIAARAGQGAGAALLTPAALSIITTAYAGAQRAKALATWGALGGAGAAAGVLAGGVLTSWLGWRSVFLVNVPIGAAAGLLSLRLVPRHGAPGRAAGPLLPRGLWRSRSLVAGVLIMFGATGLLVGTFFLNSLYLQGVQHASALRTGLEFLPLALVIGASAHLGSRLLHAAGTRVMITAGLLLMGGGALLLTGAAPGSGYLAGVLPGLLVIGAGTGLVLPGASVTALSGVAASEAGAASGLMTAAHEIGAAVGVAVFSAAGVAVTGGVAAGYRHGFAVAAALAAGLAVTAAILVPAVRPAPGAPVAVH
jgi:predicted MFS family arabinose efflux permease